MLNKERLSFMPFLVAGYPDFQKSLNIAKILARRATVLEIGFPNADSVADGPTIQTANDVALKNGMNTNQFFRLIMAIRKFTSVPIVVLASANLVYQVGIDRFYRKAHQVGIDAILVPDLPIEEARPYVQAARRHHVHPIFLVSQTTSSERLQLIIKAASGFLYLLSSLGVTGGQAKLSAEVGRLVRRVKKQTDLPLVIGFGIKNVQQIRLLRKLKVDGYIVGSALVKIISRTRPAQYREVLNKYIDRLEAV